MKCLFLKVLKLHRKDHFPKIMHCICFFRCLQMTLPVRACPCTRPSIFPGQQNHLLVTCHTSAWVSVCTVWGVIFLIAVMWGFPAWWPVKHVWTAPGLSFLFESLQWANTHIQYTCCSLWMTNFQRKQEERLNAGTLKTIYRTWHSGVVQTEHVVVYPRLYQ